ncbi:unnamed protein product, partial [Iphiclides podalirius]
MHRCTPLELQQVVWRRAAAAHAPCHTASAPPQWQRESTECAHCGTPAAIAPLPRGIRRDAILPLTEPGPNCGICNAVQHYIDPLMGGVAL